MNDARPPILIRRAEPGDAAALASLGVSTFCETFGHLYRREDLDAFLLKNHSVDVYRQLLADPRYALWLAEAGDRVGYCVAGPCSLPVPDKPANAGEIARLYIDARAQGRRLGERMLTTALGWLRERFAHVYLSVYRDNLRAQRLYEKHGFRKIHEYFYMVGEHADPEWIMELEQ
jgi:ribosomal protein S18 acetylase RimI-like enzyme